MALFSLNGLRKLRPVLHDMFGRGSDDDDGKNKHDPVDMDKLWKDFNHRLNQIFGRKKKGSGLDPENGSNDSGKNHYGDDGKIKSRNIRFGFIIAVIVAFFIWLASGFFIVQEGETGIVMTFGRYSHMTGSGVNWRYPYPIQSHEVVNVSQVRTVEVGYRSNIKNKQPKEALMLTNDENIIDIQFAVQYRLKSAADWIFHNRNQEEMVRQVAETSIREVVGKNKMDFILYEGRDQIAHDAHTLMQQIFDQYGAGVQITNVSMQGVQPPEQVQAAFDDAVKAGQDREQQKNLGEAYANDILPRARGAAARLIQEAEGYRDQVVANAEGNAARFKLIAAEYQKAPAVTRERIYIDAMQEVFSSTTKVMIDAKNGSNLLYLPFDKLVEQVTKPVSPAGENVQGMTSQQIPAQPSQENTANRSRETRDRGGR